jgi:two-component system, LytTR family, response regulator
MTEKMNIRTLIVEDEEPARTIVKTYLSKFDNIELIGEASDGFSAVKMINEMKPDLLFLDIQLPKLTGFEILELIEHAPVIIFTTAYDQFAIKAFEMNATDYLLKPFAFDRFEIATHKAFDKINSKRSEIPVIKKLVDSIDEKSETIDRIVVKSGTKIKVIPAEKVMYIEAQDDYVMIFAEESKHLKEKTMKYFETHLDPSVFIRIHRSYIVNINYIVQLEHFSKENYLVILKNGAKLKVSDSGYKNLKTRLNF